MLTDGGTQAEDAILAREREFVVYLSVDWNKDGGWNHELSDMGDFVHSAKTDRELNGQAPAEIMLIEGASAGQMTFTVGGEHNGLPMSAIFSPYNGNSPLYTADPIGAELTYWLGIWTVLGIVWYPQFRGNIRTITPNRADGTCEIEALDFVEKLRRPVDFAAWAISDWWTSRGKTTAQLCDPQWVMRHCLMQGNVGATKYQPGGAALFWWTGGGGYVPDLGVVDNTWASRFPPDSTPKYVAGGTPHPDAPEPNRKPLVLSALGNSTETRTRYFVRNVSSMIMHTYHFLSFTLNLDAANTWQTVAEHDVLTVHIGDYRQAIVRLGAGKVRVELREQDIYDTADPATSGPSLYSGYVNISPAAGATEMRVFAVLDTWDGSEGIFTSTGTRAYLEVGGTKSAGWMTMGAAPLNKDRGDQLPGMIQVDNRVSVSDIGYGNGLFNVPELETPTLNVADPNSVNAARSYFYVQPTYGASLDPGLNRLSYLPYRQGADAWEVLKDVASADWGAIFWDEQGSFRFWNQETILGKRGTIARTYTLDEVQGLQVTNSLDSVRNVYTVHTKKKNAVSGAIVYESSDPDEFYIPADTGLTFIVGASDAQMCEPWNLKAYTEKTTAEPGLPMTKWNDAVHHGFVYCLWDESSQTWGEQYYYDAADWVTVRAEPWGQGQLKISIFNQHPAPIRFANGDGTARFRIQGTQIVDVVDQTVTWFGAQSSYDKYGYRNLELSGDWYQEHFDDNGLLETVGPRTGVPIPTTDAITVVGDPRLQLGDCIEVLDPEGMGERMRFQILGISREWSLDDGLTDTLTVELMAPPKEGIWDSQQYGRWDETFIWS